MRPHRRKPTRLPRPWDSPGRNTGVGCHFLLQCMKVKSEREVTQSCLTLSDPMDFSLPGSSIHGIFQARVLEWGAIAFSARLLRVAEKRLHPQTPKAPTASHSQPSGSCSVTRNALQSRSCSLGPPGQRLPRCGVWNRLP